MIRAIIDDKPRVTGIGKKISIIAQRIGSLGSSKPVRIGGGCGVRVTQLESHCVSEEFSTTVSTPDAPCGPGELVENGYVNHE